MINIQHKLENGWHDAQTSGSSCTCYFAVTDILTDLLSVGSLLSEKPYDSLKKKKKRPFLLRLDLAHLDINYRPTMSTGEVLF